jgi:putative DNA primase/helicase
MSFDINSDLDVANLLIDENELFYYNQSFYQYDDNYWKPIQTNVIKSMILEKLIDKYKQGRVNNILDIMQLKLLRQTNEINLNSQEKAINVQNGMYYLNEKKLTEHNEKTKEKYSTNLFAVNFDEDATCPRWSQFVYEIFDHDEDKYQKVSLLQEFLGYCLTNDVSFQTALLLLGNGSNGKSIVIQVMEKILGKENYSNIELQQLSNKNYVIEIQNKHLNICTEIDSRNSFSSGIFKRIVAGETLTGDAKFKNPIKFQPYCKLLFATNDLPKTTDTTKGYFRRLKILKFNRSFEGKHKDPYLMEKLNGELDGVFNWLLQGLERLYENKNFSDPESSIFEVEKYLESSNSVVSFISEKCEINHDPSYYVKYDDLYREYRIYCSDSGDKPFKKMNFKSEIEKHYQGIIIFSRAGILGNHFQNIKIAKPVLYNV